METRGIQNRAKVPSRLCNRLVLLLQANHK